MTVSLAMMLARSGAMMGNLLFPILLRQGCAPPFMSVGVVIFGNYICKMRRKINIVFTACAFLSLLLPNTDLKPLQ